MTIQQPTRKRPSTVDSTVGGPAKARKSPKQKPPKPYPEFPLYAHAGGVWAKRIGGREHYFGPWRDPNAALARYLKERDYLHAGLPLPADDGVTVDELVNRFLVSKQTAMDDGQLSRRQYLDYVVEAKRMIDVFGRTRPVKTLGPTDWARLRSAMSENCGPVRVRNCVIRCRSVMKWGGKSLGLPEPMYGDKFKVPTARAIRLAADERGELMFEPAEIFAVLDVMRHNPAMTAAVWLGINCGLGNTDCSLLRDRDVDLATGMLPYPRPKTGARRRCALWPETVAAVLAAMKWRQRLAGRSVRRSGRRLPADLADRVMVTDRRRAYLTYSPAGKKVDSISTQFAKYLKAAGVHRKGLGFYSLRRTYRTVADETLDWPAIDLTMGHVPADSAGSGIAIAMGARYRQRISDERLRRVAAHVRAWLLAARRPALLDAVGGGDDDDVDAVADDADHS